MVHSVKCKSMYFHDVVRGVKRFEVRYNDRNYQVGDLLVLCELDFNGRLTGCTHTVEIIYILDNCSYLRDNYVVLGIKDIIQYLKFKQREIFVMNYFILIFTFVCIMAVVLALVLP